MEFFLSVDIFPLYKIESIYYLYEYFIYLIATIFLGTIFLHQICLLLYFSVSSRSIVLRVDKEVKKLIIFLFLFSWKSLLSEEKRLTFVSSVRSISQNSLSSNV